MLGIILNLLDTQTEKDKFTDLYNEYKDLLYWIALNKTNNVEDAEECVQETFLYVAKHFEKIDEVKSKRTKCYLSTIVQGFAIDIFNESKLKTGLTLNENINQIEPAYFENYEAVELLSVFDEVLNEKEKVILYLKYVFGYKSREIAEIYNVKDSYIRKTIQLAKEKIKTCFDERI